MTSGIPDSTTLFALTQAPASSTAPVPAYRQCEASLNQARGHAPRVGHPQGPKGLKKLAIVAGSTLTVSR